jgi:urease accessory protein
MAALDARSLAVCLRRHFGLLVLSTMRIAPLISNVAARPRVVLPLAAAVAAPAAFAHILPGTANGLVSGLEHPISGIDHVLAMVAVGIWGAQLGKPAIWMLPVAFPLVMSIGGVLGVRGVPLPGVEIGIAASALALGLMIALAARPPLWAAAALVGVFAIFHGHAHGAELPHAAQPLAYGVGFVLATGFLHATGIAIGVAERWKQGRTALRLAGGAIALAGVVLLKEAIHLA